jgi:glycerate kinase
MLNSKARHILIAADSFKDALSAPAVCAALARGIQSARKDALLDLCPLADGGEGTADVLAAALQLRPVDMDACDPLRRPLRATYFLSPDHRVAFVEMARSAGLQLLPQHERNPLKTTTFGLGLQIAHAISAGVEEIVLAIGGSATNDAGIGMAQALGWRFLDAQGRDLPPIGQSLRSIRQIVPPATPLPHLRVHVICDVQNPLFGPMGAARVYARQKGANTAEIEHLDEGLRHFSRILEDSGHAVQPDFPGSGAAGGMGFAARFFLHASLQSGVDLVMDLIGFEEKLAQADLLVTGEGKIDHQTAHGKLIQGLCRRAAAQGVPVLAFCGKLEASPAEVQAIGLTAAYGINAGQEHLPLATLLGRTAENLEQCAAGVFAP